MRTTVKDWKRENAFRRLKLMGISIAPSVGIIKNVPDLVLKLLA